MITKKQIAQGLMADVIRLDIDPNMKSGIVARIGEDWIFFGGKTAEEYNDVDLYRQDIPFGTIVDEIYDVLHEWQAGEAYNTFRIEDDYFEAVLKEKLPRTQNQQVQSFMDYLRKTYSFDAVTQNLAETITRFAMCQGSDEEEVRIAKTLLEPLNLEESEFAFFGQA